MSASDIIGTFDLNVMVPQYINKRFQLKQVTKQFF